MCLERSSNLQGEPTAWSPDFQPNSLIFYNAGNVLATLKGQKSKTKQNKNEKKRNKVTKRSARNVSFITKACFESKNVNKYIFFYLMLN